MGLAAVSTAMAAGLGVEVFPKSRTQSTRDKKESGSCTSK